MTCLFRARRILLRHLVCLVLLFMSTAVMAQPNVLSSQTTRLWEPIEWKIENVSFEDNPFDVVAKVVFVHAEGKEKRITEMFYADDQTWKFRFTGTKTGKWTFTTQSINSDLNGYHGQIEVRSGATKYGFVTHQGNKWARYVGDHGELEAFVPQFVMYRIASKLLWAARKDR